MIGFNVNNFTAGSDEYKNHELKQEIVNVPSTTESAPKKKKAKRAEVAVQGESIPAPMAATSMSYIQQNIPYASAYEDTNRQLDESINQLNMLGAEVVTDLAAVRNNKTMRNKYGIINDMAQTATSILSTKISAIKEKNSTINTINKLELDRLKQVKTQTSEEDDNTRIANLYNAFVNTPIGGGPSMLGPAMPDMMLQGGPNQLPVMAIGNDQQTWESNLNPADARMVLEAKGSIETVVMYDEATGNRWFEVVDKMTRQPVPGVEKPDSSYIYDDVTINIHGGFAKDSNRNVTYPLIVVNGGAPSKLSEY